MKQPRVGCGAAVVVDGKILLMRRLTDPEAGAWGLAGGKIDFGETAAHAAEREILEELGIAIRAGDLLCFVDQIDLDAGTHWVSPVYLATAYCGEPRIMEPAKCGGLDWFDLARPPSPLTAAAATALRALAARS